MSGRQSGAGMRLIIGLVIAVFAIISYLSSQQFNPVTGENQYLSLTSEQEIALGLQSAPEMIAEYGGESPDTQAQQIVDQVGETIVNNTVARTTPWQFDFHVLNDQSTVNAFALPGGQIFITEALLSQLQTQQQLAGVLSHEVTHVLARDSAEQIAKSELTNGLVGAVGVATGTADAAQTAAMIGQLINMKYGRDDETQADLLGVCLMRAAGFDTQGMVEVMQILQTAGGGSSQPEFLSTHPSPENRIRRIQEAIANPQGDCSS